jgi:hypothetical protein
MEPAEFRANDEEHAKERVGVLDCGKERRVKTEREGYFCRLVKVGLEDMRVELDICLKDLFCNASV